ncbi:D-aspartate oxidase 1 isoform X2 [Bacillus rossius redtenbacheri]|uniref:D-aspartate oxidase 1 isoform X2 n=1 Tax=Bacillus rossius redtenbacheri TaxID=93214 RepID=UPI002FDDFF3B
MITMIGSLLISNKDLQNDSSILNRRMDIRPSECFNWCDNFVVGNLEYRKWSHATYNMFQELWQSKQGSKVGLKFMPLTCVSNQEFNEDVKILHQGIPEYKVLNGNQLAKLSREHGNEYRSGFEFNTFTCVPRKLMQHLLAKFVSRGGRVEQRKVASLRELALEGYSVVVNCPGLQAEELVADKNMFPIRGQVVMVQAPWQQEVLVQHSDESSYVVIPNQDSVFLGGTSQKNNRDITVNPSDSRKILDECYKMIPRLKTAKILKEWVGLRPGRINVRLELGDSMTNSNGYTTFVVHNYGHGGSGVTLSWGCALEVVALLRDVELIRSHSKL